MSDTVTFNVTLPGARRTHKLVFHLQETVEEKHGCIKVKAGKDKDENNINVWVILQEELKKKEGVMNLLNNEIGVLKLLDHRHVLKLFQVFASEDKTYVLTEKCNTTLHNYVKEQAPDGLDPIKACSLFNQILSGITYVHSRGLAHRNITPHTILVDEDAGTIRLSGFQHACLQSSKALLTTRPPFLDPAYTAPELKSGPEDQQYHGKIADSYSVACVLYFMLTGRHPTDGTDFSDVSEPVADLIRLATDPNWRRVDGTGRIGIEDIKAHGWVAAGRKHSSTGDAAMVLNADILSKSAHHASGVGFNREVRLGSGLRVNTQAQMSPGEDEGCSSPESLIDDSFSPLPRRAPRSFGDGLNVPEKAAMLSLALDTTITGFDLSPPASPSMKSKRALKLNTLNGVDEMDGVADDAEFAASPMGAKVARRQLPPTTTELHTMT
eukprot:TRINITY_DN2828_c0_g1_i2.p1 TRINITY_DN2828_c0_g1~~TRINITY_DN2828_c0_g1_i2.p1  ORF type:complete len:455 (+),score=71.64 TRINITY_DN2828_c0_g1_i2:49-1365(+)